MIQNYTHSLSSLTLDGVALGKCGDGAELYTQPRDRVALGRSWG